MNLESLATHALELMQLRRFDEAQSACGQMLAMDADCHTAYHLLGCIADRRGRLGEAERYLRKAGELAPRSARYAYNHGTVLFRAQRYDAAAEAFRRTLELQPDHPGACNNLGALLQLQGKLTDAEAVLSRAVKLSPHSVEVRNNLGNVCRDRGQLAEARTQYRAALAIRPDYEIAGSNLLMCLCYEPDIDAGAVAAAHREFERRLHAHRTINQFEHTRTGGAAKLRIGYLSPDFRTHSVAYFIESVLERHNRERFEVFCYANLAVEDPVTLRLKRMADHWRRIHGTPDREVAERIHGDNIDILVDLAGHSGNNRLPVFLYRPAPVQVTWIGYPNTTGLAAMDWRITDWWADPQGEEQYHSEKLCRLTEGFLCYRPSPEAPPLSPPPAVRKGYITFGSFNSLPKVTSRVVALWSRVLRTVPGSRLLLKSKPFADPGTRRRYRELFARHGIGSGRLELRGNVASVKEHLATYDEVDIALDPFPYNGTTTTCEALWMGVPVVGLAGKHHAARVGLSLLSRVGLAGMVATDEDGYNAVARMLASDPARLAALRKGLRPAVANSSLCNARAFVAGLEEAYERMWAAGGERK